MQTLFNLFILLQRFGSKVVFFGIIIENDDDDDGDDGIEGRKLAKPDNEEFYGDASQGFEVKVYSQN